MIVNIIFYEDPNPEDCNVFEVFEHKSDAKKWLEDHNWEFDVNYCIWRKSSRRGFAEILEKKLQ